MTPFREQQKTQKTLERIKKCTVRQDTINKMDGSLTTACKDCGANFWVHPVFGRSTRCCSCRVLHMQKMQNKWTDSYTPKAGFPKPQQFQEESEIHRYFANHKLTCLECGHEFRGLQQHINHMHLMAADDYKIKFGIPLGYGLVGDETKEKLKVFMIEFNAALSSEEIALRIERMHAAHPKTGGIVSTQPVIKKKRAVIVRKMIDSDRHISRTISGTTLAPCSECGDMHEVSTWSAVTNPCRIKCKKCNAKKASECSMAWAKKNPERIKKQQKDYRERLKEKGLLQQYDKKKQAAKKQKKQVSEGVRPIA